jgi:hypothetical protein
MHTVAYNTNFTDTVAHEGTIWMRSLWSGAQFNPLNRTKHQIRSVKLYLGSRSSCNTASKSGGSGRKASEKAHGDLMNGVTSRSTSLSLR